jgi:hypothetical protein
MMAQKVEVRRAHRDGPNHEFCFTQQRHDEGKVPEGRVLG